MTYLIGTDPNQVPTNADLGNLAFQNKEGAVIDLLQLGKLANNPELTSGTANGVPYLNASKVLTSGSALTFDGTKLKVATTELRPTFLYLDDAGTAIGFAGAFSGYFGGATNNTYTLASYNGPIVFATNAAEQMRLTSTGLGIGTSSPALQGW